MSQADPGLKAHAQPELDLSGRTERKHSRSDANSIYVVAPERSPVDLSCRSSQQAIERRRR